MIPRIPRERDTAPRHLDVDPQKFYKIVDLMNGVSTPHVESLKDFAGRVTPVIEGLEESTRTIAKAATAIATEERRNTRTQRAFGGEQDPANVFGEHFSSTTFLGMVFNIVDAIRQGYLDVFNTADRLRPGQLVLIGGERQTSTAFPTLEKFQQMRLEAEMNQPAMSRFIGALLDVDRLPKGVTGLARNIENALESYYKVLLHRHSVDGIQIHGGTPVATDLAITIYENVDANGEIADGKSPDEVSAYTMRKAEILAQALKTGLVGAFVADPKAFITFVKDNLTSLHGVATELSKMFREPAETAKALFEPDSLWKRPRNSVSETTDFQLALQAIDDIDPQSIVFREKTTLLSPEEKFNLKFRNDTLKEVVSLLSDDLANPADVIEYILNRKAELRTYFQEENSFYVCKIGGGNPFTGEAPGALTVIPGTRPRGNLDEILGSGFDEAKRFFKSIGASAKFHDLFVATSPSRTADKSNCLLVGPQGCGKTEILRAVGSDKASIGIFAQGSDFNTCWKGEAEKNPKRLFEEGLRLQREAKKHVHFLIDEIDAVLNSDREYGSFNLTLEFQILMDGVVSYPNLSVWGATNNPERIPMPMMRRFSKVLVVGELSQEERVQLLKQFVSSLPTRNITNECWDDCGKMLEGATGDVIRKIADRLWRDKMADFTHEHPVAAEALLKFLNEGERFDIGAFGGERRREFHAKLSPFVTVTPDDLTQSVMESLDNVAIHHEITTAVQTYARAKAFLSQLHKTREKKGTKVLEATPEQPAAAESNAAE